jgi:hypothetical protein
MGWLIAYSLVAAGIAGCMVVEPPDDMDDNQIGAAIAFMSICWPLLLALIVAIGIPAGIWTLLKAARR